MAAGPALKLVHCTFTCGPMALSNQPLALPTMACACVMLGNAPTRMVVCAQPETALQARRIPNTRRLLTLVTPGNHGEDAGFFFFLGSFASGSGRRDQVGERGVFQNSSRGVAHIKKQLVER